VSRPGRAYCRVKTCLPIVRVARPSCRAPDSSGHDILLHPKTLSCRQQFIPIAPTEIISNHNVDSPTILPPSGHQLHLYIIKCRTSRLYTHTHFMIPCPGPWEPHFSAACWDHHTCSINLRAHCLEQPTMSPSSISFKKIERPGSFLPYSRPPMCRSDVVSLSIYAQLQPLPLEQQRPLLV